METSEIKNGKSKATYIYTFFHLNPLLRNVVKWSDTL